MFPFWVEFPADALMQMSIAGIMTLALLLQTLLAFRS